MLTKKRRPLVGLISFLIFSAVLILRPLEALISIKTAAPMLILPLLAAFSIFSSVYASAAVGFIAGACLDSVASGAYCFNTLTLMLLAVAVTLCANNLFNKNIRSAAVISLILSVVYFVLKWIIFYAVGADITNSMQYLLEYALPSAVYSSVFIFPFYFLYRKFEQ